MTTILVTGATGTVGSRVMRSLAADPRAAGIGIRAMTRRPGAIPVGPQVEPVIVDLADPASLEAAVDGVDAIFLGCGNDPGQVAFETAVIGLAARHGVRLLVKLSARGAAADAPVVFWRWHAEIESGLAASGVPAAVLRPGFSMANLMAAAPQVRAAGIIAAPAADARIAMVDPVDVAAVAVECLLGREHAGRTYTLTGPEAIDYGRVAAEIGTLVRRPVSFLDVPAEAAVEAMTRSGLPPFVAQQLGAVYAALRSGGQSSTTDDVGSIIGRPPRALPAFLAEQSAHFDSHREPLHAS